MTRAWKPGLRSATRCFAVKGLQRHHPRKGKPTAKLGRKAKGWPVGQLLHNCRCEFARLAYSLVAWPPKGCWLSLAPDRWSTASNRRCKRCVPDFSEPTEVESALLHVILVGFRGGVQARSPSGDLSSRKPVIGNNYSSRHQVGCWPPQAIPENRRMQ